jgi:hypothetical protein
MTNINTTQNNQGFGLLGRIFSKNTNFYADNQLTHRMQSQLTTRGF